MRTSGDYLLSIAPDCLPADADGDGIPNVSDCVPDDAQFPAASDPTCDGFDDDCDGEFDEDYIGGAGCSTGEPGICDLGRIACVDVGACWVEVIIG